MTISTKTSDHPNHPKIKDATELDYAKTQRAAERIVKICQEAFFAPPEAMDLHLIKIEEISVCIDAIVDSLRLIKK